MFTPSPQWVLVFAKGSIKLLLKLMEKMRVVEKISKYNQVYPCLLAQKT